MIRKGLRLLLDFGCHSFVQWGHLTFPLALLYNSGHHSYHEMKNNIWFYIYLLLYSLKCTHFLVNIVSDKKKTKHLFVKFLKTVVKCLFLTFYNLQMVWENTTFVGCALRKCEFIEHLGYENSYLVVCNYAPE